MKFCPRHKLRPAVPGHSRCKQCIAQTTNLRARHVAAGLCRCGKTPEPGFALCSRCRKQLNSRAQKARAAGLCSCGGVRVKGRQCCQICLDRASADRQKLRISGLCYCGKRPPRKGRKQCQECLDLISTRKAERRAQGKCMCGSPIVEGLTKCISCLSRQSRRHALRMKTDEAYAIARRFRICISGAFTRTMGAKKIFRTEELLGCKIAYAKKQIEQHFEPGMSWKNHGAWHIDHHIPCNAFDLTIERQQRLCNNWRNLRPLWGKDNQGKSYTLPYDYSERLAELETHVPLFNPTDPMF